MNEFWSLPIFLWVAIVCFAFSLLWGTFSGVSYRMERRLPDRHPRRTRWADWSLVEQIAAIMGIISFIIQVAQWVYPLF